jgi:hypothetical protein
MMDRKVAQTEASISIRRTDFPSPFGGADLQADHGVALNDRGESRRVDPSGARSMAASNNDLVETAPHHIPGGVWDLLALFIAPDQSDPEIILPIRSVKDGPVLHWITLSSIAGPSQAA